MKKIIILTLFIALLSSCMNSRYYKGCDGKKKNKMINKW